MRLFAYVRLCVRRGLYYHSWATENLAKIELTTLENVFFFHLFLFLSAVKKLLLSGKPGFQLLQCLVLWKYFHALQGTSALEMLSTLNPLYRKAEQDFRWLGTCKPIELKEMAGLTRANIFSFLLRLSE